MSKQVLRDLPGLRPVTEVPTPPARRLRLGRVNNNNNVWLGREHSEGWKRPCRSTLDCRSTLQLAAKTSMSPARVQHSKTARCRRCVFALSPSLPPSLPNDSRSPPDSLLDCAPSQMSPSKPPRHLFFDPQRISFRSDFTSNAVWVTCKQSRR